MTPRRSADGGAPPAIDPRVRDRRQAVAKASARRRLRVVVTVLGVVAFLGGAVALAQSPVFDVDVVRVRGARHTSESAVASAAGLDRPGTAMLTLDRRGLARRIERLPWVATADVERKWPSTVVVRVRERRAVATVGTPSGLALVDADGRVLGNVRAPTAELVAIALAPRSRRPGTTVEPAVRDALAVVVALPARLVPRVAAVHVVGEAPSVTFDIELREGVKVRMGPVSAVTEKLRAALAVLDAETPPAGSIIDVRVPRSPTLKRPG